MSRAKKKLSLQRETLRVLNAFEIRAVGGAGTAGFTNAPGCEKTGIVGHCEQPSRSPDNCGGGQHPQTVDLTVLQRIERTQRQPHSQSFCLDRPPLSGRTLPPTAMD